MTKIISLSIATAVLAVVLSAVSAGAATRTWVSGHGTDSDVCGTLSAPCRTFASALIQTAAGGEIDILDPADFGTVTINKSISIVNDGVGTAGILAGPGVSGITINAGGNDSVHLRGLTIEGSGGGTNGIQFNTGGNLAIENCVVRGFTAVGISISPSTSSSFSVSNTIASNNSSQGIAIGPTGAAAVTGVLNKVRANNNTVGIVVDGEVARGASLDVTIIDSEASNNLNFGVFSTSSMGQTASSVTLRNSIASYNGGEGLGVGQNAILRVAHSVVTGNAVGVQASNGGILYSYGDNNIDGNANNNTAILTSLIMR
jgi:hypothetical protein